MGQTLDPGESEKAEVIKRVEELVSFDFIGKPYVQLWCKPRNSWDAGYYSTQWILERNDRNLPIKSYNILYIGHASL